MENNFIAFRMILRMASPAVFAEFAPTLDGILLEALSKRYPERNDIELRETMRLYLKFNEEWGVFHASSAVIGVSDEHGLVACDYIRNDYLANKLTDEMFTPRKRGGKYSRLQLAGGPTKKRLVSRPAYAVPYIVFDGFGNPGPIQTLLETFVLGVGYDAQNVNMGAFHGVDVIELDHDISLVSNQRACRPLPASSGAEGLDAMIRLVPPYYSGPLQVGVVPQRVRATHIKNLMNGESL